jgi:hypothetical protein
LRYPDECLCLINAHRKGRFSIEEDGSKIPSAAVAAPEGAGKKTMED